MPMTIIGGLFILIGSLMFVSGTLDLVAFEKLGSVKMVNATPAIRETPAAFRAVLELYQQNFMLVTLAQVVVSLFMVFSGVFFLKLHGWARTVLEVLSWIGLVYVLAVEVFYITTWMGFVAGPVVDGISKGAVSFMLLGVVLGTALWGILLAAIVKYLRGKVVKDTLEKAMHNNHKLSYNYKGLMR